MQALILAAGTGSRLGKYTKENTKCMLEVNGETLIKQALNKLDKAGIKKLILVVGYKKENLIEHLGNKYKDIEIEYVENPIYDKTNNIYSLYLAREKLMEDDTILIESDLMFDYKIVEKLLLDKRENLAVVDKYKSWMDGTSAVIDDEDNILDFFSKNNFRFEDVENYYKTVNIYKFSKEFSANTYIPFLEAYIKTMGDNEYYESVLRVLTILHKKELKALRLDGDKWYEIDDAQDKANAEIIFAKTAEEKLSLVEKRYGGYWRFPELKDFCYLVNPYFPPKKMQEEIKAYFYDLLSQYPSGLNVQNMLAGKMFKVEPENILVGNGAAEIIKILGNIIDGNFGLVFPTFNEYPESIGYERVKKFIPTNKNFSYSIDELINFSKDIEALILINPDNPSGHFFKKVELNRLMDELEKNQTYLILDESFVDFSSNFENQTMMSQDIIDNYKNLIIIKSISKSYGIPGFRLGVVASSNQVILSSIRKEISIWNINSFAEYFLQIIGKYEKDYISSCKQIAAERDRFFMELQKIKYLRPLESQANYFMCEVKGYKARDLVKNILFEHNFFIKDLTGKIGFENKEFVRIAVRDTEDNDSLLKILQTIGEEK